MTLLADGRSTQDGAGPPIRIHPACATRLRANLSVPCADRLQGNTAAGNKPPVLIHRERWMAPPQPIRLTNVMRFVEIVSGLGHRRSAMIRLAPRRAVQNPGANAGGMPRCHPINKSNNHDRRTDWDRSAPTSPAASPTFGRIRPSSRENATTTTSRFAPRSAGRSAPHGRRKRPNRNMKSKSPESKSPGGTSSGTFDGVR